MGKKYIITETQERILTRLIEGELGPEESVFVINKNPYKYEGLENARKLYSSDLKDGDLFFIFENIESACDLINKKNLETIQRVIPTIEGKTIRANDKVYTIGDAFVGQDVKGDIIVQVEMKDSNSTSFKTYSGKKYAHSISTGYSFTSNPPSFDYVHVRIGDEGVTIPLQKAYGSEIPVLRNDFCKYNPFRDTSPTSGIENVPDEYFEIRKIQRTKTDF